MIDYLTDTGCQDCPYRDGGNCKQYGKPLAICNDWYEQLDECMDDDDIAGGADDDLAGY